MSQTSAVDGSLTAGDPLAILDDLFQAVLPGERLVEGKFETLLADVVEIREDEQVRLRQRDEGPIHERLSE